MIMAVQRLLGVFRYEDLNEDYDQRQKAQQKFHLEGLFPGHSRVYSCNFHIQLDQAESSAPRVAINQLVVAEVHHLYLPRKL